MKKKRLISAGLLIILTIGVLSGCGSTSISKNSDTAKSEQASGKYGSSDSSEVTADEIPNLLPIGSVVMLKEAEKPLMIYGIRQYDTADESIEYDYIGVPYPEGNIGDDFTYLFNHADIDKVLFNGYETEEQKAFYEKVAEAYK